MSGPDVRTIKLGDLPEKPFPEVKESLRVWVSEDAFDRFTERGGKDLTREVGGVLVGEACRDAAGPYVRVDDVIEALHADEKSTELTFTHDTWEHIHKEMDTKHEGRSIVGWCHTHPGFGVFLSERDQFIHTSFFDLPHQIALVFDPKSREHGVFTWHEGEARRNRRYFVGEREHRWDGARESLPTTKEVEEAGEPAASGESGEPARPQKEGELAFFAIGAILLLVLGGFAGWWVGGRSAKDVLHEAERRIDLARMDGMRDTTRLLNADLLAYVRSSLGGEAVLRPLSEGLMLLDEGISAVPEDAEGRAKLDAGRAKLAKLFEDQGRAQIALTALERASRLPNRETAQLLKLASDQQQALGQLYAELAAYAAENGDRGRAERLLKAATTVDPQGADRYDRQREKLAEEEGPLSDRIRIDRKELFTKSVDDALEKSRRLRGAGLPPAEADSPLRRLLKSSLFYLPLAGLLAAVAAWAVMEPHLADGDRIAGEIVAVHTDVFVLGEDDLTLVIEDREVVVSDDMTTLEAGEEGQPAFRDLADLGPGTIVDAVGETVENRLAAYAIRPTTPERAAAVGTDTGSGLLMFLFFPVIAACIGFALTLSEGFSSRNWLRMLERTALGTLLAVAFSVVAMFPATIFMGLGTAGVMLTQETGQAGVTDTGLFLFASARSMAWCCIGAALGLGLHLVRSTKVQLRNAVIGGALGGALGGIFFDPVDRFFLVDSFFREVGPSRLVGVAAVGVSIGLFIALVDQLAREAWVRVRTGPLAGKAFVIYRSPTVIGSAPQADIYLMKDPGIDASHAAVHRVGNRFEIEDLGSREGTRVAGEEVRRRRLTSGDQIVLGATILEFEERATVTGEET